MAKFKLNLKEIDFKQFLIQKGERVALWAMVAIMALLIVFGVFVNGFSRGSASGNAGDIARLNGAAESAFKTSRPGEEVSIVPAYYLKAAAMPQLVHDLISCMNPNFMSIASEDKKWRKPDVLTPDEFQVDLMRGLVRTFIPGREKGKPTVKYLRLKEKKDANKGPAGREGPGMGRGPNMNRFRGIMGQMMQPGMMQQPGGMGMMGMMNFPGMMMPGGMRMPGPMMPTAEQGVADDGREVELFDVPIDKIGDADVVKDGRPAEAVIPVRIAVIQAAFPYKKQYELFRRALHYDSIGEMEQKSAVDFVGLVVERREVGADGKAGDWQKLDLIKDLRPFLAFGIEPEDPQMLADGLVWPKDRLVVPRPLLARELQYPKPELKTIQGTLKAIEDARAAGAPPPERLKVKSRLANDFDFYEDDSANGNDPTKMGTDRNPRPMPPVAPVPTRPNTEQVNAAFGSNERLLPEKCLVRFIDVLLVPGKTYEYRMQIEMSNPLEGQADKAIAKAFADLKKLSSEWVNVPQKLFIPREGDFYFVEDSSKPHSSHPDKAWVQIHRWVDWVPVNPSSPKESLSAIGDWAIAESSAYRGEYIGKWEEVELPVWNPKAEAFVLAQHPETLRRKGGVIRVMSHKGPAVDFTTGSILVDFEGGKTDYYVPYTRDKKEVKVHDEFGVEALVLTPEGKLLVRDGRKDRLDTPRENRLKEFGEWVKAVKDKNTNIKGDKKAGGFFDEKKP